MDFETFRLYLMLERCNNITNKFTSILFFLFTVKLRELLINISTYTYNKNVTEPNPYKIIL